MLFCDIILNIWAEEGEIAMRIKEGFVLREVAGQIMVIATGEASKDFYGMIRLNGTGKIIWQGLQEGISEEEIAKKLCADYEVDEESAKQDVNEFLTKMADMGFLVNE